MRLSNWDRYELSYRRVVTFASASGSVLAGAVYLVTAAALGNVAIAFSLLAGLGAAYTVLSAPRRAGERAALNQAREAPSLAAAVTVHLRTTRSRNRTLLTMQSEEDELAMMMRDLRRRVLLGFDPVRALSEVGEAVSAPSVMRILGHVADRSQSNVEDEGDEYDSMIRHSVAMDETKTPVFIAVSFFAPIMFVLFASLSNSSSPATIFALMFLQLVLLNLVFSFASADRGKITK